MGQVLPHAYHQTRVVLNHDEGEPMAVLKVPLGAPEPSLPSPVPSVLWNLNPGLTTNLLLLHLPRSPKTTSSQAAD